MKVFKAILGILLFLSLLLAGAVFLMYKLEGDRWKAVKESFEFVQSHGTNPENGRIVWQGKILEKNAESTAERILLIQIYKYGRPAGERYKFYAINSGTWNITVDVGDMIEVRGDFNDFDGDLPVVRTQFFAEWFYPFIDLGFK